MDLLNKFTGDDKGDHPNTASTQESTQSNKTDQSSGGLFDKFNNALGGGEKGEKNEDAFDKAVDWVQEHVLKSGPQNNESAVEQAKDEAITDSIRAQYKKATGRDFPIPDK